MPVNNSDTPASGPANTSANVNFFTAESLPRVLPFLVYMFFIFLGDMLGRLGWSAGDLRWLYGIKIAAVLAVLLHYRAHYGELAWTRPAARTVVIAIASGVLVFVLWIKLDAGWMTIGASQGFDPRSNGRIDWPLAAMRVFGAALVVPVMEELFWRSFLLRWIASPAFLQVNPRHTKIKAFLVTVMLFGFEHNLWFAGIIAGAAYSLLYMRSQTLWSPILAHGVTNALLGTWIISTGHWTNW